MDTKLRKFAVITTFHDEGLKLYAQRMIDTFCQTWPSEITLYLYPEKCNPTISDHKRIIITDLDSVKELTAFKTRWKNVPKANGDVSSDPIRSKRRDSGKGFKWNAIRFAHKTYAIFDCAKKTDADVLIWMDADTVCHNKIDIQTIERLIPNNTDLCYLGRHGKFSECGLYSMNLRTESIKNFLKKFQEAYDDAENGIFQMAEWHDSFVFDEIRKVIPNLKQHSWSVDLKDIRPRPGNTAGEGHPLINTEWGKYLDHLKGDSRKKLGKSKREDLKINHNQLYWQTAR